MQGPTLCPCKDGRGAVPVTVRLPGPVQVMLLLLLRAPGNLGLTVQVEEEPIQRGRVLNRPSLETNITNGVVKSAKP